MIRISSIFLYQWGYLPKAGTANDFDDCIVPMLLRGNAYLDAQGGRLTS